MTHFSIPGEEDVAAGMEFEEWQRKYEAVLNPDLEHRDGVAWHDAKRPFPIHLCSPQTEGWVGFTQVQRCACGAMRTNRSVAARWHDKNQRWGKLATALTVLLMFAIPIFLAAGLVVGLAMAGFHVAALVVECVAIAIAAFLVGQRIAQG